LTLIFLLILCSFFALDVIFPFSPQIPYSQLVLDNDDQVLSAYLSTDQKWRMYCSKEEVNARLIQLIIRKEDQWFWYHPGVNIFSVIRAAWQNSVRGERVSGASTITMQVVRLLKPADRTLFNKTKEMIRAVQLELHHSKKEILEMYLNLLPYGGNIEGIKAASYLYYGQKPITLSPAQMITLAIIPNNPRYLLPGVNNKRIMSERNYWLSRMQLYGLLNRDELQSALAEPLTAKRMPAPGFAPHFCRLVRNRFPGMREIRTALNPELQEKIGGMLYSEVSRFRPSGITNGAVVVLNNTTRQVEAYLGSADFTEDHYLGQVDGCIAVRSPGSALKPFLYAAAIDQGLITPKSFLCDVPMNFNGYRPQNFDEKFRGQLTASEALALSLNVPAVDLANRLGVNVFIEKLARGGLKWIEKRKSTLGLSVVLGGCGTSLLEITSLYSSLPNGGVHHPLCLLRETVDNRADTLFSEQASWLITEMLTNLQRPDLPTLFESSIHLPHIAWKTGTSYGRRDAWSIGYNPEYTVGVWMGNFDGTGVADLSGSECATPLLFRIFNYLMLHRESRWFEQPHGLDFRLVCSESGLPPNDFCLNLVTDYFIPTVSPNRKCNHLSEVFVNPSSTMSYCRGCLPEAGYRSEYYPNLLPGLIAYYQDEQIPYRKIPPHNPECRRISNDMNPVITSLIAGREYILYGNSGQQLQLACNTSSDVSKIYWYIDNVFYREAIPSEKIFFKPGAGKIKISCCDDKGRNTDISIMVSFF
jgi:penicillin-binding protein 1C